MEKGMASHRQVESQVRGCRNSEWIGDLRTEESLLCLDSVIPMSSAPTLRLFV